MKCPRPALIVSWDAEPLYLDRARVAAIYGLTERAIDERVRQRRIPPPALTHPSRWSRADLERAWRDGDQKPSRKLRTA